MAKFLLVLEDKGHLRSKLSESKSNMALVYISTKPRPILNYIRILDIETI